MAAAGMAVQKVVECGAVIVVHRMAKFVQEDIIDQMIWQAHKMET